MSVGAEERPSARPRRSRRMFVALVLITLAGFLLGLGLPIHHGW